ncbi:MULTISPECIES: IclR family transcriptional regulator [Mycobacteriales]|uniref:IclR family transcriptional regulator n=1 Tax=Mycobacteriales TaxID=85007 RepID=UPI000E6B2662|nr:MULTISPECIES: IclR family transcriptional regulator [Mycobacteriales]AXY49638.1 putative IclR family transcriptional regulator [Rhodococcus ruber]WJG15463.1 IclR family transcriptional regulator [Gordonia sp. Swx-4]
MAGNTSDPGASVASRLLTVLGAFDDEHRAMTLSQIARRAGLPLPTTHRLVAELATWGGLVRRPTGEYVVGRRIWELALLAPTQTGLRQIAEPFLHDVYGATLATVHLAVREGAEVLYLDRLSGTASVPIVSTVGSRLPLHCTAVGKVLLAHAPDDVLAETLGSLTRMTPYTVTQPGLLRQQLARVRRNGYATTAEEMSLGACSVAVPVLRDTAVVASLGLVVPRLTRDRTRLVGVLQAAAFGIGRELASGG